MNSNHRVSKPFLIGVAGGTASGKSTVCQKIMAKLGQDCQRRVAIIKQDSFYRTLSPAELALAKKGCYNFDHPDAVDEEAMYKALKDILNGKSVKLPIHDYMEHQPKQDQFHEVNQADVVLFEGVLIFYFPKVRDMFHMKLFVDTDSDTRLSRRVVRDVQERGRSLDMVLNQYDQFVKPAFEEFCLPTKKYSDMIIPRGAENEVAIGLINHNVTYLLSNESQTLRSVYSRSVIPLRPSSPFGDKQIPSQQSLQQIQPIQQQTSASDSPINDEDPLCAVLQGHRSRSDSVVASAQTAILVAAQRFRKDQDQDQEE